jgi:N-acetylneuraminic acid mutarotase
MFSSTRQFLATAMVPNAAGESILYAMGGKEPDGSILGRVLAYNVATNKWTWKADMPSSVAYSNTAAVINGKIYITGGLVSPVSFNYGLYVYNPATGTWASKKSPPNTSLSGVSGVINNKLYVATSCEQEDCEPSMGQFFWRYDPATDQWTTLTPPPFGSRFGGTIGGKLYLANGNQVEAYDPATGQWSVKTTSIDVGSLNSSATLGAKLYVFGSATHVYDPTTNVWTTLAAPPTGTFGRAATRVALNGKARIEVVGGPRPGNNLAFIP